MEMSRQLHAPGRFTPGIHFIEGWMDRRAGLSAVAQRK